MVRVYLFGAPRIERQGQEIQLRRTKALALLAYMALAAQPKDRDALLALLWPEFDEASGRNNLRRELSLLRSLLDDELLAADRRQVRWSAAGAWVDVAAFAAQLAARRQHGHPPGELCPTCAAALAEAARLHRDDFLAGFHVPESAAFDEWQFFQREELRQQLGGALAELVSWHGSRGEHAPGLEAARRWLALDRLHEPAQRALIRLYAISGQRAAALRQYEECARLLAEELGGAPEPETTALYEAVKARRRVVAAESPSSSAATPRAAVAAAPSERERAGQLPPPPPGFVGRQRELSDIIRRLTDRACRLLTLVGPGGIGKTRLALQVAHAIAEGWAGDPAIRDGVLWVPLAAVSGPSGIAAALAAAAGFSFYPGAAPQQQVLDYFRGRRVFAVLDNFEHLLDSAEFVGELLAAAPQLRLLITSRQALNLREEWFHPIEGLSFPAADDAVADTGQLARYDAVRLFELHARRLRGDFSLSSEREHVVRLCRLVDGIPLALELAASWLTTLSVGHVVAALERDLDVLATRDRSMPARHRSMRGVLEESWRQLSSEEQRALAGLAVFRGGFSAESAATVAGASLPTLASLVERSLLRPGRDGRFQLHELLRQFAAEQLAADASLAQEVAGRHADCYLGLLAGLGPALVEPRQAAALAEVGAEVGNIRAAWERAVEQGDLAAIDGAADAAYDFFWLSCRYQEGEELFALAAERLAGGGAGTRVHTRLAVRRAGFASSLGRYDHVRVELEACLAAARSLGMRREEALALHTLGQVVGWSGDHRAALELLRQSLAISRAIDDAPQAAGVLQEIALHLWDRGEFAEVQALADESLALSRRAGRPDRIGGALDALASAEFCLGLYDAARQHYLEALAVFEQSRHRLGIAMALGGIGLVDWARGGAEQEAIDAFEQSLAMMRAIGHRRHVMDRMNDLARVHADRGEVDLARRYAQEGLVLARELGSPVYVANSLCCLAWAAIVAGELEAVGAQLREAATIAAEGRLVPVLAEALLYRAELLVREAARADERGDEARAEALALASWVARQPTWHVFVERARRLQRELAARLPAAAVARAHDREAQLGDGSAVAGWID